MCHKPVPAHAWWARHRLAAEHGSCARAVTPLIVVGRCSVRASSCSTGRPHPRSEASGVEAPPELCWLQSCAGMKYRTRTGSSLRADARAMAVTARLAAPWFVRERPSAWTRGAGRSAEPGRLWGVRRPIVRPETSDRRTGRDLPSGRDPYRMEFSYPSGGEVESSRFSIESIRGARRKSCQRSSCKRRRVIARRPRWA